LLTPLPKKALNGLDEAHLMLDGERIGLIGQSRDPCHQLGRDGHTLGVVLETHIFLKIPPYVIPWRDSISQPITPVASVAVGDELTR
jgi:hypothetical protein